MGVREEMGGDRTDETQSLVWYDMPSVYKYEIDAKFENLGYFTSKAGLSVVLKFGIVGTTRFIIWNLEAQPYCQPDKNLPPLPGPSRTLSPLVRGGICTPKPLTAPVPCPSRTLWDRGLSAPAP